MNFVDDNIVSSSANSKHPGVCCAWGKIAGGNLGTGDEVILYFDC